MSQSACEDELCSVSTHNALPLHHSRERAFKAGTTMGGNGTGGKGTGGKGTGGRNGRQKREAETEGKGAGGSQVSRLYTVGDFGEAEMELLIYIMRTRK